MTTYTTTDTSDFLTRGQDRQVADNIAAALEAVAYVSYFLKILGEQGRASSPEVEIQQSFVNQIRATLTAQHQAGNQEKYVEALFHTQQNAISTVLDDNNRVQAQNAELLEACNTVLDWLNEPILHSKDVGGMDRSKAVLYRAIARAEQKGK